MVTHQKVTHYDYVAYFGCSFFVHFEPNNTFPQLLDSYVALFDLIGSPLDISYSFSNSIDSSSIHFPAECIGGFIRLCFSPPALDSSTSCT